MMLCKQGKECQPLLLHSCLGSRRLLLLQTCDWRMFCALGL